MLIPVLIPLAANIDIMQRYQAAQQFMGVWGHCYLPHPRPDSRTASLPLSHAALATSGACKDDQMAVPATSGNAHLCPPFLACSATLPSPLLLTHRGVPCICSGRSVHQVCGFTPCWQRAQTKGLYVTRGSVSGESLVTASNSLATSYHT